LQHETFPTTVSSIYLLAVGMQYSEENKS